MSEAKHTPEPWRWDGLDMGGYIWGPGGEMIADTEDEEAYIVRMRGIGGNLPIDENARRIVACVNACKGIPTDDLARGVEIYAKVDCPYCHRTRVFWNVEANNCPAVEGRTQQERPSECGETNAALIAALREILFTVLGSGLNTIGADRVYTAQISKATADRCYRILIQAMGENRSDAMAEGGQ